MVSLIWTIVVVLFVLWLLGFALKDALTSRGTLMMYASCADGYDDVGRGLFTEDHERELLEKMPAFDPLTVRAQLQDVAGNFGVAQADVQQAASNANGSGAVTSNSLSAPPAGGPAGAPITGGAVAPERGDGLPMLPSPVIPPARSMIFSRAA